MIFRTLEMISNHLDRELSIGIPLVFLSSGALVIGVHLTSFTRFRPSQTDVVGLLGLEQSFKTLVWTCFYSNLTIIAMVTP